MLLASLETYTQRQASTHIQTHTRTHAHSHFPRPAAGSCIAQGESGLCRSTAPASSFDGDGKRCPTPWSLAYPDLFPPRYQEVQAAQTALGIAVAEALPKAEKALATVKQVVGAAAPRLGSMVTPEAMVSSATLDRLMGWQ